MVCFYNACCVVKNSPQLAISRARDVCPTFRWSSGERCLPLFKHWTQDRHSQTLPRLCHGRGCPRPTSQSTRGRGAAGGLWADDAIGLGLGKRSLMVEQTQDASKSVHEYCHIYYRKIYKGHFYYNIFLWTLLC